MQRNALNAGQVRSALSNGPILLFHDLSQAGTLGASPGVAFSEQEEGGTNGRYRNEVTAGPPGRGGVSYITFTEQSAVVIVSSDGKLRR